MVKAQILKSLQKTTKDNTVQLVFSDNLKHGDYTTNVAFQNSGNSQVNPREKAYKILEELKKDKNLSEVVSKIEIAGPGFINFFLKENLLKEEAKKILVKSDEFGISESRKNEKVIVEFTDPNPFKELHIGHLYSNIVGECICRLITSQGATVKRACYQGDVGLHVAKALWGLKTKFSLEKIGVMDVEKKNLGDKVKFLGEAYAMGAKAYEEDPKASDEIKDLNKEVFDKSPQIYDLYQKGRDWSLEYFDEIYKRVGTKFDYFFFESEVGDNGARLVKEHIADGIFEESDGAIVFKGEKYGLHTRVFVNKLGLPTYEAKELGLAPKKYELFKYDSSIILTGNEINEYFKVLFKVLSLINPELAQKTKHIGHGFVRLPEGKMSSRTGNIVRAEDVLNIAHDHAISIQGENKNNEASEMIGQAAIKYAFLKNNIGGDIEFELEKSVSFEGNSGPYLQYTAVRAKSVLEKYVKNVSLENQELGSEEVNLMRILIRFPEFVTEACERFSPSHLCTYLYTVAQEFNSYYSDVKILGSDTEEMRIATTKAACIVLTNGLKLLGINVPSEM